MTKLKLHKPNIVKLSCINVFVELVFINDLCSPILDCENVPRDVGTFELCTLCTIFKVQARYTSLYSAYYFKDVSKQDENTQGFVSKCGTNFQIPLQVHVNCNYVVIF